MLSKKTPTTHRLAIDLFSGAGGLTQGLKQSGFSVVGAIESQPVYAESYQMNHPEVNLKINNIELVDPTEYMKELGLKTGELDLLAGCPPCQGYSTIGTRNKGKKNDPRNELVFQVLRFALIFKPKTIMMENVPALAKDVRLSNLKTELEKVGYKIDVKVLNMSHYKVPQARKRMIMLASRVGDIEVVSQELDSDRMTTVREAISSLPPAGQSGDQLHDIIGKHSPKVKEMI
ncbi:MAG: DNA cytosine methyltransferase, partial [Candidatus Nomurabacteria bacterium]|nr:DNA cytosine methyltransferase [Candidatus Nomurabacteria bacterium]